MMSRGENRKTKAGRNKAAAAAAAFTLSPLIPQPVNAPPRNPISDSDNNAIRTSSLPLTGITGHPRKKKLKQNKNRHLRLRFPVGAIRELRQSFSLQDLPSPSQRSRAFSVPGKHFPGKRRNREIPRSQARWCPTEAGSSWPIWSN